MSLIPGKMKIALFLAAMLVSAAAGAVLALKFATGTDLSDALLQRKIREEFSEKIARVRATQGDVLELAVLESTLTFELTDAWENVPAGLGSSSLRVRVPAVFRFFVRISEPIRVSVEEKGGGVLCRVDAPKLAPVLPVAFDTSRLAWERDIGLLRFNRDEMTDALHEKISRRLMISAKSHAKSAAVRDAARRAFERFAAQWLSEIRALKNRPGAEISVRVVFDGETPPQKETAGETDGNGAAGTAGVPVTI